MGEIKSTRGQLSIEEVKAAIGFDQPKLTVAEEDGDIVVRGRFLVLEDVEAIRSSGPITEFDITIFLDRRYPKREPLVFEMAERIPRFAERHINPDGDCCVTVWEDWLARAADTSFAGYLNGPLREYFLGQHSFELTKKWPFGERAHGKNGLFEAYAEALGIPNKKSLVIYYLRLLSKAWPKGHWQCPCNSGKILRQCHRDDLMQLHEKIPTGLARRMLRRLRSLA